MKRSTRILWALMIPIFFILFVSSDVEGSCDQTLGMEDGRITNGQITSPSIHNSKHMPHHARRGHSTAWCSAVQQLSHLQIKLGSEYVIQAITLQGGGVSTLKWVTKYKLRYRQGGQWKWYMENGREKVIGGVEHFFKEKKCIVKGVTADAIRVYPQEVHGVSTSSGSIKHACLRLELFGCLAVDCGRLSAPVFGYMLGNSTTYPATVRFYCDIGYQVTGFSSLTCQQDGRWNGQEPTCNMVDCGNLTAPVNGRKIVETTTLYNWTVGFACDVGYQLAGSPMRRCQANGRWSGQNTLCTPVQCRDPGTPRNCVREVPYGFSYGDVITYRCFSRHVMKGPAHIVCQHNKMWSASAPKCLAPCSNPGNPSFGNRIGNNFEHGKTVRFQCARNYVLNGSRIIRCREGRWSGDIPRCLASCDNPGKPEHGTTHGSDYWHGMSLRFSCAPGYRMKGASTVTCSDGKWSARVPRCIGFKPSPFTKQMNSRRQLTLPTTVPQTKGKCHATGLWQKVSGMDKWCERNCARGHCPSTHCSC